MPHLIEPTRMRIALVTASAIAGLGLAAAVGSHRGGAVTAATTRPPAAPAAVAIAGGMGADSVATAAATAPASAASVGAAPVAAAPTAVLASAKVKTAATSSTTTSTSTSTTSGSTTTASSATTSTTTSTSSAPAPRPVTFGVFTPGFPGSTSSLDQIASEAGRAPGIVMWYVHWGGPWSALNPSDVQTILARGATPMITWMTDDPTASSPVAALRPAAIAAGSEDAYIRAWADGLRALGGTVMIRLDHEMNGNWYPWSPGVNGTTSSDYVAMWRHVHRVFAAEGATNIRWVWSPNVEYTGSTPLAGLYPGDAYVDVVGLDGYNWGTSQSGKQWQSFDQIFDTSISDVHRITGRPFLITEIASTSVGGDKAAWITDFLTVLLSRPDITGFVWFDADKETDWRFEETSATLSAFSAGLLRFG